MAFSAHRSTRPGSRSSTRNDENRTPANTSTSLFISSSMLQSGGLSPLPSSEQLYDIQLPDISSYSPLLNHKHLGRGPLAPTASVNRRSATPSESSRKPHAAAKSTVVVAPPTRRSRSRSISARPADTSACEFEAMGGLMTPPASGMSQPSSSHLDQTASRVPHPTSPTPLQPRSRTQSPQKRQTLAATSATLTPGALLSTPARNRRTASPHGKRTRDLVETPVIARVRGQTVDGTGEQVAKHSPNPRARKNTKTFQSIHDDVDDAAAGESEDVEMDSDAPLAEVSRRLEARGDASTSAMTLTAAPGVPSAANASTSRIRAAKAKGRRIVSGAAYKDAGAASDDDGGESDVEIVQITRRNGPEASFIREAREKGWDRIANSPVRTIYLSQEEPLPRQRRAGSVRAKSKTPKPESPEAVLPTTSRGRSASASRNLADSSAAAADESLGNVSNQSIKSSSSQSSTSTVSRRKSAGKAETGSGRRRASSSASTSGLRIKTANKRATRRISAPPPGIGEVISEHPAMPESPSEDPLLLVGPEPDFSRRYDSSMSFSRHQASPSKSIGGIRGASQRTAPNHDATFAIPEEDEGGYEDVGDDDDDDDGYNDYEPLVFEDASRVSPSKAARSRLSQRVNMLTSTPLPGARKAAQLPSEIPLPSSEPATPATLALDMDDVAPDVDADESADLPAVSSPAFRTNALEVGGREEEEEGEEEEEAETSRSFDDDSETRQPANSSAEISRELPSMAEQEIELAHVTFGQLDGGDLDSDSEDSQVASGGEESADPSGHVAEHDAAAATEQEDANESRAETSLAESSLVDASVADSSLVDSSLADNSRLDEDKSRDAAAQSDVAASASVDDSRAEASRAEESHESIPDDGEQSVDTSDSNGSTSGNGVQHTSLPYTGDQDARLHGADRDEPNSSESEEEDSRGEDESGAGDGRGAKEASDGSESGSSSQAPAEPSEADTSRIDDEDEGMDGTGGRLDSEEIEILAGSSTRDRTPELPLDENVSRSSSSDGFEILDIVSVGPNHSTRGKQRARDEVEHHHDSTAPIHTLQLLHQDDLPAAIEASRSMASRSYGGNASMSVDASSASAYSRFMRLSQQTTTPIVEISSLDAHAAARATAILKLYHQYVDEGWIQGDETSDGSRLEAGSVPHRGGSAQLPDEMNPRERAKVQQVVRILKEAERIAAIQRGDEAAAERSMAASSSNLDAVGSLTLPQILMDAEINIARQDAQTDTSSDDGFSVRSLLAPSDAAGHLRTPQISRKVAGAPSVASPATPFLPGGFPREPASVARPAAPLQPTNTSGKQDGARAAADPAVWSREDWVRLDRFFSTRVKAAAKSILRDELASSGFEDVSQTRVTDIDKVALQIQALTSVDAYALAADFLDECGVEEDGRRAEWASSKIRFRIPALQRKYLRKLEAKHPGRVTEEHAALLDRSARGDMSGNASFSLFNLGRGSGGGGRAGNDSIATEDLDWSLTGMTTRIHAGRGDGGEGGAGEHSSSAMGMRPKEGRRGGRVSFGTPYRLGTHSTPMPTLKRVQEQAKQDGLYPSLAQVAPRSAVGRSTIQPQQPVDEASNAASTTGEADGNDAPTSTPSMVSRTTRLLSRMSGSFFGLVSSPASASLAATDASTSASREDHDGSSSSRALLDASRGSTGSRIPTLKKTRARQHTPIRDFGTRARAAAPPAEEGAAARKDERRDEMVSASSVPVSVAPAARAEGQGPAASGSGAKEQLGRKPSITAADLQAASRSIREKRTSSSFLRPTVDGDRAEEEESHSARPRPPTAAVGRVIERPPPTATATASATVSATTQRSGAGAGEGGGITIRRSNTGFSGLTRPTALSLLPDSEASHKQAREKVKQLAQSRQERGWKSPRPKVSLAAFSSRPVRPLTGAAAAVMARGGERERERDVALAAMGEMRKRTAAASAAAAAAAAARRRE